MSQIETCFFERYAHITLSALLGHEFDELINLDRPDLQSPDGKSLGIEVTRAMEQNKYAAQELFNEIGGYTTPEDEVDDLEMIRRYGYGYGLQNGRYIGMKESYYWKLAKPLLQILENKVSKAMDGLYGEFGKMGLYVFCKEQMDEAQVIKAYRYVMDLQKYADRGYDFLYLCEADALHVCNLTDGISDSVRLASYTITPEMRRQFYIAALKA